MRQAASAKEAENQRLTKEAKEAEERKEQEAWEALKQESAREEEQKRIEEEEARKAAEEAEEAEKRNNELQDLEKNGLATLTEDEIDKFSKSKAEREDEQWIDWNILSKKVQRMDNVDGLAISFDCRDQFYQLMRNRVWSFVISTFNVQDKTTYVQVDRCGVRDADHEQFLEAVPEDQCAWIIIDLKVGNKDKALFINYVPEACTNRNVKTISLFKKDTFKKRITYKTGINPNLPEVQIRDKKDLSLEDLLRKV